MLLKDKKRKKTKKMFYLKIFKKNNFEILKIIFLFTKKIINKALKT